MADVQWRELDHPRDRLGRFIETGAEVRVLGGVLATVLRNLGGGRIEVRRNSDGRTFSVHRNYLTVMRRPDGSQPTASRADAPTAAPPQAAAADVPDVTPANTPIRPDPPGLSQLAADVDAAGRFDDADLLTGAARSYQRAHLAGDDDAEADARAAFNAMLSKVEDVNPAAVAKIRAAMEADVADRAIEHPPEAPAGPTVHDLFDAAIAEARTTGGDTGTRTAVMLEAMQGMWDGGFQDAVRQSLTAFPAQGDAHRALQQALSRGTVEGEGDRDGQTGTTGGTPLAEVAPAGVRPGAGQADVLPGDRGRGRQPDRGTDAGVRGPADAGRDVRPDGEPTPVREAPGREPGDARGRAAGPDRGRGAGQAAAGDGDPGGPGTARGAGGVPDAAGAGDRGDTGGGPDADQAAPVDREIHRSHWPVHEPVATYGMRYDADAAADPGLAEARRWDGWDALPVTRIARTDLVASEDKVSKEAIDHYRNTPEPEGYTIHVYQNDKGQYVIADGHHRVAKAYNQGATTVDVKLADHQTVTGQPAAPTFAQGDPVVYDNPESFVGPRVVTFSHYADNPDNVYIDSPGGTGRFPQRRQVPLTQVRRPVDPASVTAEQRDAMRLLDSAETASTDYPVARELADRGLIRRVNDQGTEKWAVTSEGRWLLDQPTPTAAPDGAAPAAVDWRQVGRDAHAAGESRAPAVNAQVHAALGDSHVGDPENTRIMREFTAGWDEANAPQDIPRENEPDNIAKEVRALVEGRDLVSTEQEPLDDALDKIGRLDRLTRGTEDYGGALAEAAVALRHAGDLIANYEDADLGQAIVALAGRLEHPDLDLRRPETDAAEAAPQTSPEDEAVANAAASAFDESMRAHAWGFDFDFASTEVVDQDGRRVVRMNRQGENARYDYTVDAATGDPVDGAAPEAVVEDVRKEVVAVRRQQAADRRRAQLDALEFEDVPASDLHEGDRIKRERRVPGGDYYARETTVSRVTGIERDTTSYYETRLKITVRDDDGVSDTVWSDEDGTLTRVAVPMEVEPSDVGDAPDEGDQPAVADAAAVAAIPDTGQPFKPTGVDDLAPAGERAKLDANMEALRTLRRLQADPEHRPATPEEQAVMAKWAGWGGLPDVFDERKDKYAKERVELREQLLSESEYREAMRNTLNAHYTDARVVQGVWAALEGLGFDGGKVLEPGSGSGTFIGFAPDAADMVGVELDSTTAALSRYLYPKANVRNESFADTNIPDDYFDATIGNVPFGPRRSALVDPIHNADGESIHNHFILKSLAMTKPGGTVAVLTSRYTLDSQRSDARVKMAQQADLVGAIRLPNGSHQRASGTDVIEDIVIFRKRKPGEEPQADQSWVNTTPYSTFGPDGERLQTVRVNEYFVAPDHEANVLGRLDIGSGQYGPELKVVGDKDMPDLDERVKAIVREARAAGLTHDPETVGGQGIVGELIPAGTRHEGHIRDEGDGKFTIATSGVSTRMDVPRAAIAELSALLGIRDTAQSLLDAEAANGDDTTEIADLRDQLNRRYDAYAAKYGSINRYGLNAKGNRKPAPAAVRALRKDPMSALVRALDKYDPTTDTATKASIFTTRAVAPRHIRDTADSPADALTLSMDLYGEIRLSDIARLLGTDEADARAQLGDMVYDHPPLTEDEERAVQDAYRNAAASGDLTAAPVMPLSVADLGQRESPRLVPAAEYLSGNVRRKLAAARAAAERDPRYQANVDALEKVIPAELGPDEIDGRLGAAWIGAADVEAFLKEILNDHYGQTKVVHSGGGTWTVQAPKWGTLANEVWGTADRDAGRLVQGLLEQRPIIVTKDKKQDVEATLAAQAKADEIQERFSEWLWEDADRARRLQAVYNDQFNNLALRTYDGSGRQFPGLSQRWAEIVHPHVKDAVERIVNEPTALLAHVVGAGKTTEMVMGVSELKRLGLVRKPAIVVPNHMLEQFSREFLDIYPGARLLAASSDDLKDAGRREFVARAATGDWDAVIITKDAFKTIPMSPAQQQRYIDREMASLRQQLLELQSSDQSKAAQRTVKKMEQSLISAEQALKKALAKAQAAGPGVTFEQTGIDYLVVDEAHEYSNLRTLSNIPSASAAGSGLATDLHMKLEYLRETTKSGRVATFATGTPIRNTVTQAYMMIRYLRPDLLEEAGIHSFDQWAATFGQTVEEMELKPEGSGFRQTTRFAKFRNVPELLRMFHTFADVKLAEDLDLPTPDLAGGKAQTHVAPRTEQLAEYIAELGDRAELVRSGGVDPQDDNMLKISTDGRKAALSMALVGGTHEPGKIEVAADRIAAIYERERDQQFPSKQPPPDAQPVPGALQTVFMDMGTPKPKAEKERDRSVDDSDYDFIAYDALKSELVARGVPADQIRYMHEAKNDAQKAQIFADARAGRIAVLLGSTPKMGIGTNVQDRMVALHHLDAPWRPSDLEQRDGRIMRQGNLYMDLGEDVEIHRYVTQGSFDTYMWQTLERKAKFINQIMRGSLDVREIEDVGDAALNAAEVKALSSGNPDLLDKAKIDTLVTKLERLDRTHNRTQSTLRSDLDRYQVGIAQWRHNVADLDAAIARRTPTDGDNFAMDFQRMPADDAGDTRLTDRSEASDRLAKVLDEILQTDRFGDRDPRPVADVGGLTLTAQVVRDVGGKRNLALGFEGVPGEVALLGGENVQQAARQGGASSRGLLTRVENGLSGLEARRDKNASAIETGEREISEIQRRIGLGFARSDELEAARRRQARIAAKMARDAERQRGVPVPFDPAIDTDQFDDPRFVSDDPTVLDQAVEVEVPQFAADRPPAAAEPEYTAPSDIAEGDRIQFVLREMSGETAEGVVQSVRRTGGYVMLTIRAEDGQTYTRAYPVDGDKILRIEAKDMGLRLEVKKDKAPPPIDTGSFVQLGNTRGRVDMIVTSGKVPGTDDDVTGSESSPAARITVWKPNDDGTYSPTRRKIASMVKPLKRIQPLRRPSRKADTALDLVAVLAEHSRMVEAKAAQPVAGHVVQTVYERGLLSWPGPRRTSLSAEEWALGRVKAFLSAAAGTQTPGYRRDSDLLPKPPEPVTHRVPAEDVRRALAGA